MADKPLVLVIDDETGSRESMAIAIEKAGCEVRTFDDARKALEYLEEAGNARAAVCDLRMPGMDGVAFLKEVRERQYDLGVVLVTAYGSIESAVEAMRVGADDYLTKPVDLYELRQRVMNLIEKQQLKEEVVNLREMLDKRYGFESIIGRSAPMDKLFEQMKLVAPTRSSVLIIGESGTGKELVANAVHRASPRRNERFLAINCGAIPSDILESELFGHERGAFTGAVSRKIGKFEIAHRGTLFLDEISELYPELQVKLLRVLEERQVMRVGGSELIDVDFRLIAATNRDLEREVAEGRFREDLYYRRSEEHTSELQSPCNLVCRLLLEKKNHTETSVPRRHSPARIPPHLVGRIGAGKRALRGESRRDGSDVRDGSGTRLRAASSPDHGA